MDWLVSIPGNHGACGCPLRSCIKMGWNPYLHRPVESIKLEFGLNENKKLNIFQVFASVVASFFGVQSNEKRARDFTQGRARDFIIVGVVLTVLFILVVFGIVKLVMSLAMA